VLDLAPSNRGGAWSARGAGWIVAGRGFEGSPSEAASYLFEECYRQGVLTSEYSFDNKRFLGKIAIKPDKEIRDASFAADLGAQETWRGFDLETDPDDVNALFALTLSLA
jgi:hypothetical protein